jgi:predicted MFS family arabinose efflux permease
LRTSARRVFAEEMGISAAQRRRRRRQWTLALVTVAALLERADEALLPAVYREVGAALGASPTALGSLTLCRALVQAVCYPLATCAAARHDRARVVAAGAFLWAVATLLVGASGTFLQVSGRHVLFLRRSPTH